MFSSKFREINYEPLLNYAVNYMFAKDFSTWEQQFAMKLK